MKLSLPFFVVGSFAKVVDACAESAGGGGLNSKETSLLLEKRRPTGEEVENELDRWNQRNAAG